MPPEIMKTCLLDEWVIVTRSTKKDGYAIAHEGKKYPIPKEILESIANDYLIKQLEGTKKGYTYKIVSKGKQHAKVTVERIKETTEEDCEACKRYDENQLGTCFDFPELNIEDARKECAVHDKGVSHGIK